MFTVAISSMLMLAAAKADPQDEARKAYSNCLVDVMIVELDKGTGQSDFNKLIADACAETKATYHALIVKSERGYGSKPAEAEQYATEETQSIQSGKIDKYGQFSQDKTRPTHEP